MSKRVTGLVNDPNEPDEYESHAPLLLDYALIPEEQLALLISEVTTNGGAIRFGYTRDGNSFCIGVYGDGEYYAVRLGVEDNWLEAFRDIRARFDHGARPLGNLRIGR